MITCGETAVCVVHVVACVGISLLPDIGCRECLYVICVFNKTPYVAVLVFILS
jgi:hypothetical protein